MSNSLVILIIHKPPKYLKQIYHLYIMLILVFRKSLMPLLLFLTKLTPKKKKKNRKCYMKVPIKGFFGA